MLSIWRTLDPGKGWVGVWWRISRTVLTSFPPLPRQRRRWRPLHQRANLLLCDWDCRSFAELSMFFFPCGPHLTLPTPPHPLQFNFSNGEQPESLCDGSKPHVVAKGESVLRSRRECECTAHSHSRSAIHGFLVNYAQSLTVCLLDMQLHLPSLFFQFAICTWA